MLSSACIRIISTLTVAGALWATTLMSSAAAAEADKAAALATAHPDRGFIDDGYALTEGGGVLLYVNTDGASWASLHALGLPPRPDDTARPASALTVTPGADQELIKDVPLSAFKLYVLPEDRVLIVSRDQDKGGVVSGTIYSLRTRAKAPELGSIGPATDITLANIPSGPATGPVIVALTRPSERANEYRVHAINARTLKPITQKIFKVRDGEPRVPTEKGSAMPLYFLDDYLTLVAKHDGFYDKKKDFRQPDFVAFLDALTGKISRSRPISDPAGLLELSRLRGAHSESVIVIHDAEQQRFELVSALERGLPDGPAESRSTLTLPRAASMYEPTTLAYQLARPGLLVLSLTVDPVNEQAVAARRTDPDLIDFCAIDLSAATPGPAQRLRILPGNKRPNSWTVTRSGRLALLRKHKGFSRGGTDLEIYDLDLPAAAPAGK